MSCIEVVGIWVLVRALDGFRAFGALKVALGFCVREVGWLHRWLAE